MDTSDFNKLARALQLLTVNNPKIRRNSTPYLPAILHLAPAHESGYNTCPMATAHCSAACLHFAGRGAMKKVQQARIRRTRLYFEDRPAFLSALYSDIWLLREVAARFNLTPLVRLNGTSDIRWERHNIPQSFADTQFYDYTRIENRSNLPSNYHLTFSWGGENIEACRKALANNINVAVPFKSRPAKFMGYPTIDGDQDDWRFLDKSPVIIGLKLKGRLRNQLSSVFIGDNHPNLCS